MRPEFGKPVRKCEIKGLNIWVKRTIWIAIGAGLLFLGGNRIIEVQQKQAATASKKKKKGGRTVSVEVTEARRGSLREDLVLTGALKPQRTGGYHREGDRAG